MNDPAQRLARELRANAETARAEAHSARMDLIRVRARHDHLRELRALWPVLERVVLALAAVEGAPPC